MKDKNADERREFHFRASDEQPHTTPERPAPPIKATKFPLYYDTDRYLFDPVQGLVIKRTKPKRKYRKKGAPDVVDHSRPSKYAEMIRSVRAT